MTVAAIVAALALVGIFLTPKFYYHGGVWGLALGVLVALIGIAMPFIALLWMQMNHNENVTLGKCIGSECYFANQGIVFAWGVYAIFIAPVLGVLTLLVALLTPAFVQRPLSN